jgi:hypothetical protein
VVRFYVPAADVSEALQVVAQEAFGCSGEIVVVP